MKKNPATADAVDGVVIPSKVLPGVLLDKHKSNTNADAHFAMFCPRCEDAFAKRDHVNSHLAACVGRNGNLCTLSPPRYNLVLIRQDLIRFQRLKQADYIYTWGVVQSTKLNLVNCPPTRSFASISCSIITLMPKRKTRPTQPRAHTPETH